MALVRSVSPERHIHPQETILVGSPSQAQVVAVRQFNDAFKGAVIDFHDEKLAFGRPAAIWAMTADFDAIAFHHQFKILPAHPGQFNFDDQSRRCINIGVGDPVCFEDDSWPL